MTKNVLEHQGNRGHPPVPPVPHARDESVAVSDRLDMKRDNVGAGVDYRRHLFAQSAEVARKNRRRNLNFRHFELFRFVCQLLPYPLG